MSCKCKMMTDDKKIVIICHHFTFTKELILSLLYCIIDCIFIYFGRAKAVTAVLKKMRLLNIGVGPYLLYSLAKLIVVYRVKQFEICSNCNLLAEQKF